MDISDNNSGAGDAESREQRPDRPGLQLLDRRLTLEMVVDEAIPIVWNRFEVGAMVRASEDRAGGRWTADFLLTKIIAADMQLWLVIENKNGRERILSAIITDVRPYESGFKACHIVAVVGEESRSWIKLKSELEAWAKASGCEAIETIGRHGWKRVLPDWSATHTFLEKRL